MGFVRSVLFPGLRLVVWAVIAVALSVLAFGGGGDASSAGPVEPSAELGRQTISAELGEVSSTIELTGTVAADPAATVRSTAAGLVTKVHRRVGEQVEAGMPLVDVRTTVEPPAGADGAPPAAPRTRTTTVTAGAAGTLASLAVLVQQDVSVGADLATVSPGTLSVSAPMTQSQQFRLLTPPATASAQARGGPAPFVCGALSTAAAATPTGPSPQGVDPYSGQPVESSTAQVTCRVPAGTTVFAGMSVDLTIDTGSARQVLVVPVSAVQGTVVDGTVWVVGDDGEPVARPVTLGLTDGRSVQVTGGLSVGEQLLEFTLVEPDEDPTADGGYAGPR